jgi:hypothetical protein
METVRPQAQSKVQPEHRLVVALGRTPLAEADRSRALSMISLGINWTEFFSYAARQQVEPVTTANLLGLPRSVLPPHTLEAAAERNRETRAIALSRTLLTNELITRFEIAGIQAIVMKGPATGITGYGDPSMRNFNDIDLLVRREDLERSRDLLLDLNYKRDYGPDFEGQLIDAGHALEFSGPQLKVELHWCLLSNYLRLRFNNAAIWNSSHTIAFAGHDIRVLSPEFQFLFLCAHGAKHEWNQLRLVCDIAQLAARLTNDEADRVIGLASELHATRVLSIALHLVSRIFGDVVPVTLSRAYVSDYSGTEKIFRDLELSDASPSTRISWMRRVHPGLSQIMFWMTTRERMQDRVGCAIDMLRASPTNGEHNTLRWVNRPLRLIARALRGTTGNL